MNPPETPPSAPNAHTISPEQITQALESINTALERIGLKSLTIPDCDFLSMDSEGVSVLSDQTKTSLSGEIERAAHDANSVREQRKKQLKEAIHSCQNAIRIKNITFRNQSINHLNTTGLSGGKSIIEKYEKIRDRRIKLTEIERNRDMGSLEEIYQECRQLKTEIAELTASQDELKRELNNLLPVITEEQIASIGGMLGQVSIQIKKTLRESNVNKVVSLGEKRKAWKTGLRIATAAMGILVTGGVFWGSQKKEGGSDKVYDQRDSVTHNSDILRVLSEEKVDQLCQDFAHENGAVVTKATKEYLTEIAQSPGKSGDQMRNGFAGAMKRAIATISQGPNTLPPLRYDGFDISPDHRGVPSLRVQFAFDYRESLSKQPQIGNIRACLPLDEIILLPELTTSPNLVTEKQWQEWIGNEIIKNNRHIFGHDNMFGITSMSTHFIEVPVPAGSPGKLKIGFTIPQGYFETGAYFRFITPEKNDTPSNTTIPMGPTIPPILPK